VTRYLRHVLPSGMVITMPVPAPPPVLITYCLPTTFISFKSADETAAEERRGAARKVLAVLQEQKPQARKRRLPRHCPYDEHRERSAGRHDQRPAPEGRANAVLPAGDEPRPSAYSLAGQPCASCVLGEVPRLPPLGFPLVPLSGA
jgi:hypothetical protein